MATGGPEAGGALTGQCTLRLALGSAEEAATRHLQKGAGTHEVIRKRSGR